MPNCRISCGALQMVAPTTHTVESVLARFISTHLIPVPLRPAAETIAIEEEEVFAAATTSMRSAGI